MPESTLVAGESVVVQLPATQSLTIFGIGDGSLIQMTNNAPKLTVTYFRDNGDDVTVVEPCNKPRAFTLICEEDEFVYTTDPIDFNVPLDALANALGVPMLSPVTGLFMRRPVAV